MENFALIDLPSPITVVCHDAGGANLILSWLENWNGESYLHMEGAAANIFRNFSHSIDFSRLNLSLKKSKALITGTGWGSNLEHEARIMASEMGVYNISVLDHWVNYRERFIRSGKLQLPDEIWVTDKDAFILASDIFPEIPIFIKPNYYLRKQLALISSPPKKNHVLYLLEPVRSKWGGRILGEYQALEYALEQLILITGNNDFKLFLRPHPSESLSKYQKYVDLFPNIEFDSHGNIASAISNADIVIGVETYGLIIANASGRRVYSSLPPWAPQLRLPHSGIIQLRDLRTI